MLATSLCCIDTVVALSAANYTASESDTSVEICALLSLFAVEFPSGLPAPITVELSTADDTAGNAYNIASMTLSHSSSLCTEWLFQFIMQLLLLTTQACQLKY